MTGKFPMLVVDIRMRCFFFVRLLDPAVLVIVNDVMMKDENAVM